MHLYQRLGVRVAVDEVSPIPFFCENKACDAARRKHTELVIHEGNAQTSCNGASIQGRSYLLLSLFPMKDFFEITYSAGNVAQS